MNYIFDNTYVLNSDLYRDVGDLLALYDKISGKFIGYKAVERKLVNGHIVSSLSYPRSPEDLSETELANVKPIEILID